MLALFEPTASMIKKDNSGYIVSSVGQKLELFLILASFQLNLIWKKIHK